MPSPAPAARRRRAVAGLAVVPATLALSLPAHAATAVEVTASAESCGVALTVSGLTAGEHRVVVTVTSTASGEVVPALPEPDDDAVTATPTTTPTTTPTATATATPTTSPAAEGEPPVTAELVLTADDDEVVVALDHEAVPDDDTRVEVEVLLDGEPAAELELTLDDCGPQAPGTPTPRPSGSPTPSGSPSPSGVPTPTTSAGGAEPTASSSPRAARVPRSPVVRPRSTGTTRSGAPGGSGSSDGLVLGGSGSSGYLPSLSYGTSTQLDAAAPAPVPAPVIAPPVGTAAVASGERTSSRPLDEFLGTPQQSSSAPEEETIVLAVPQRSSTTTPDPLADLAPAVFFLAASLGGMLTAGRRRSS